MDTLYIYIYSNFSPKIGHHGNAPLSLVYVSVTVLWVAIPTSPSGHFPRSILVSFVCTCIMLCLCRALYLAACVTCIVPVSLPCTRCWRPKTSCDHLLDGTIESARKYCVRSRFLYKSYLRASFVLENRTPVNSAVRRWYSNRAVDY